MSIQIAKVREFKGHTQAIYTMCGGEGSDSFYSAGADGMIVKWEMGQEDGTLFAQSEHPIYCLYSKDSHLLSGGNQGTLTVFDRFTRQIIKTLKINKSAIFDIIQFGNHWLIACKDGTLSILDMNFDIIRELQISIHSLRKLLLVNDEVYITGTEGILWIMDQNHEIPEKHQLDSLTVFALSFHLGKKILLSGGRSAVLSLWQNFKEIQSIQAHWYAIKDIAMNPSQRYFATCSMDKTIKVWDADNFELLKVIDNEKMKSHRSSVNKILWIEINRFISCSDDGAILCFEIID